MKLKCKKKIVALFSLFMIMLMSFGSVSVMADDSEVVFAEHYESEYEKAFSHGYSARVDDGIGFKISNANFNYPTSYTGLSDNDGRYTTRFFSTNFTVVSQKSPVYGIFLRSNLCLLPFLVSSSPFSIRYNTISDYRKVYDGKKFVYVDDSSSLGYMLNSTYSSKGYKGMYYVSCGGGVLGSYKDYVQIGFPTYDVRSTQSESTAIQYWIDSYKSDGLSDPTVRGEDGKDVLVSEISKGTEDAVADLGYLQNIQCTTLVKNSDSQTTNEYAGDKKYKFSYSLQTSTGFDLRTVKADVQYLIKIKGGYTTMTDKYVSLNTVVSDKYYAGNGASYFYVEDGILNDLYGKFRNDASLMAKTLDSQIYIYIRPICGNSYGGWSRIKFDKGNIQVANLTVDNGTTSTGNVSSEPDGEEDDFLIEETIKSDSSFGRGDDFEEAESNASTSGTNTSNSDLNYDSEAMTGSIKGLISEIGNIPYIIAQIFSFLPDWCLTLFAVGFGMVVFLIIYKLIRG